MTPFKLVKNSFSFYWKNHLGLLIGVFLTSAILTGSLLVGDSVRSTLRRIADQRLSRIHTAVLGGDRWFTMDLARETASAPVVLSLGSAALPTGEARVNAVQVLGVDDTFWKLSERQTVLKGFGINQELAKRLRVNIGDTVVVRLELPSLISRDAPLSGTTNQEVTLRKKIEFIATSEDLGAFQLTASQQAVPTVFAELGELQGVLEKPESVNVLLSSDDLSAHRIFAKSEDENCEVGISSAQKSRLQTAMKSPPKLVPSLKDFGMELKSLSGGEYSHDLRTERVFLDESITSKIHDSFPKTTSVLTYLVNGITSKTGRTPYSMITATDAVKNWFEGGLGEDEIAITQWLAEDQGLKIGDAVEVRYFVVGLGREMIEKSASFKVKHILSMEDSRVRPDWTPNFPGVSDAENCRDWEPGMPVNLDAIRDKDEDYWDKYSTTPKGFINLSVGQKLWSNRFGNLTSIRFLNQEETSKNLEAELLNKIKLSDIGLAPVAVKETGAEAAKGSVDFGGLFIGLSLFLIVGALVFSALLFIFTLEKRASQFGLLRSLGLSSKAVRKAVIAEGMLIAVIGAGVGLVGGWVYTQLAIAGLNEQWKDATVGLQLQFSAQSASYAIAFVATLLTAFLTLVLSTRGILKTAPKSLLVGELKPTQLRVKKKKSKSSVRVILLAIGAFILAYFAGQASKPEIQSGLFFGAGFLLLLSGLSFISLLLGKLRLSSEKDTNLSLAKLGLGNMARRPSRSLSVIGILAGGLFMVIAVNAFRLSAPKDDAIRSNGTGGYQYVAESTLPIYEDLNSEAAAEQFAFDEKLTRGVTWVPFRIREGDDASCLNLNRAQVPVLTGVNAEPLIKAEAFSFVSGSWKDLKDSADDENVVLGIADQATAMWGLGKGVGDTLEYQDANGQTFKVKLVGLLSGSLLQGKVLISERAFLEKYPNAAGYQFFLVETPRVNDEAIEKHLVRQLESRGVSFERSKDRLNRYYAVQNTYIGIFTLLGGLGVLLGTLGLAVLAMRNVLERKGEFALMQAIGFGVNALRQMVVIEHLTLLIGGVLLGGVSAALAIWPSLHQSLHELPYGIMLWLVVAILIFGSSVCLGAAFLALRGKLTQNLRSE